MNKIKKTNAMSAGKQGFTLVELLVAMSIFIIVITIVFGLFSSAIKGQRRVFAIQNTQENARFMIEFMAKEIRMSKINSSTSNSLNITRSDGDAVSYSFGNGKINRNDVQINSDSVSVTGEFYVEGVGSDAIQPKVTILIKVLGVGERPEEQASVNVQTTLSQRILDI